MGCRKTGGGAPFLPPHPSTPGHLNAFPVPLCAAPPQVFDEVLRPVQVAGLFVALTGVSLYLFLRHHDAEDAAEEAANEEEASMEGLRAVASASANSSVHRHDLYALHLHHHPITEEEALLSDLLGDAKPAWQREEELEEMEEAAAEAPNFRG